MELLSDTELTINQKDLGEPLYTITELSKYDFLQSNRQEIPASFFWG